MPVHRSHSASTTSARIPWCVLDEIAEVGEDDHVPSPCVSCDLEMDFERRTILSDEDSRDSGIEIDILKKYELSPESPKHSLCIVPRRQASDLAFRRIRSEVLARELRTKSTRSFERDYCLVDCRYPFEYEKGHIKHAINLFNPNDLLKTFFPKDPEQFERMKKKTIVFYCEYSSIRGPNMANSLRTFDRQRNRWPNCDYNKIYVLNEGYKHFFETADYKALCSHPVYVSMNSKEYVHELKNYTFHKKRYRKMMKCYSF